MSNPIDLIGFAGMFVICFVSLVTIPYLGVVVLERMRRWLWKRRLMRLLGSVDKIMAKDIQRSEEIEEMGKSYLMGYEKDV